MMIENWIKITNFLTSLKFRGETRHMCWLNLSGSVHIGQMKYCIIGWWSANTLHANFHLNQFGGLNIMTEQWFRHTLSGKNIATLYIHHNITVW